MHNTTANQITLQWDTAALDSCTTGSYNNAFGAYSLSAGCHWR